jgi:hypothetical protein
LITFQNKVKKKEEAAEEIQLGAFATVTVHQPQLGWLINDNGVSMGNVCGMPRVAGRLLASQRLSRMDVISLEGS